MTVKRFWGYFLDWYHLEWGRHMSNIINQWCWSACIQGMEYRS